MSAPLKHRSFPAQLLVALARTSPAYSADPRPGRSRGRQLLAALGRRPVAARSVCALEAVNIPSGSPPDEPSPAPLDQGGSSAVASLLRSLSPEVRLSLRAHPAVLSTAVIFQTQDAWVHVRALLDSLDRALAVDPDRGRVIDLDLDRARNLDLALDRIRVVARDLDLDLTRDLDLARDHVRELARAFIRVRDLDLAHVLALAHDRALARDLYLALTKASDLASDLAHALSDVLARAWQLAQGLTLDLDRDLGFDLALDRDLGVLAGDRTRLLAKDLENALSDFTGADLGDADLAGRSLTGIRWSRATRWPPTWAEEIERLSVEIEPGIFEIRGGTATADTSTVLSGV